MKKDNIKYLSILLISVISSCLVSVAATGNLFDSNEVTYDNTSSGMSSSNVKDAVDELYAAATDYSDISARVTDLEQHNTNYFKNSPHTYLDGRRIVVGEGYTNSGGYVDFYYNNENVGYLTSNVNSMNLSAVNNRTLSLNGTKVQINGVDYANAYARANVTPVTTYVDMGTYGKMYIDRIGKVVIVTFVEISAKVPASGEYAFGTGLPAPANRTWTILCPQSSTTDPCYRATIKTDGKLYWDYAPQTTGSVRLTGQLTYIAA